jgi:hypothetical protein
MSDAFVRARNAEIDAALETAARADAWIQFVGRYGEEPTAEQIALCRERLLAEIDGNAESPPYAGLSAWLPEGDDTAPLFGVARRDWSKGELRPGVTAPGGRERLRRWLKRQIDRMLG